MRTDFISVRRHWERAEAFGPDFNGSPCMCLPKKPNKYGYVRIRNEQGKKVAAHLLIYEELIGKVPSNLELDHLCRFGQCVNPWHLEPVTSKTNILRSNGPAAINARKTKCLQGHPLKGENLQVVGARKTRRCRECANKKQREAYRLKVGYYDQGPR